MSEDYKVQVSLSAPPPAQYAKGAMANFRGDTVDEVVGLLQEAKAAELLELASEVEAVWTASAALGARTEAVQPAQGATPAQAPAQQAVAPAPSCQHGPRKWHKGRGRTGDWFAWFCSAPKGTPGACDPVWANADGSAKD